MVKNLQQKGKLPHPSLQRSFMLLYNGPCLGGSTSGKHPSRQVKHRPKGNRLICKLRRQTATRSDIATSESEKCKCLISAVTPTFLSVQCLPWADRTSPVTLVLILRFRSQPILSLFAGIAFKDSSCTFQKISPLLSLCSTSHPSFGHHTRPPARGNILLGCAHWFIQGFGQP